MWQALLVVTARYSSLTAIELSPEFEFFEMPIAAGKRPDEGIT
jgi:hypothetical protein